MKTFSEFLNEAKSQFKKIKRDEFEKIGESLGDYRKTYINGDPAIAVYNNRNCVAIWYEKAKKGSSNPDFKGDDIDYSYADPFRP